VDVGGVGWGGEGEGGEEDDAEEEAEEGLQGEGEEGEGGEEAEAEQGALPAARGSQDAAGGASSQQAPPPQPPRAAPGARARARPPTPHALAAAEGLALLRALQRGAAGRVRVRLDGQEKELALGGLGAMLHFSGTLAAEFAGARARPALALGSVVDVLSGSAGTPARRAALLRPPAALPP
jgi:hypothetical protein